MKLSSDFSIETLNRHLDLFFEFLDEATFWGLIDARKKLIFRKGYASEYDEHQFSLELSLFNIANFRKKNGNRLPYIPENCNEGVMCFSAIGQLYEKLTGKAIKLLRDRFISSFTKNSSLRPLFSEIVVLFELSSYEFDITLSDLESSGGCDFLVNYDGMLWEVEVKCISMFTGSPIKPNHSDSLTTNLKSHIVSFSNPIEYPHLHISLSGSLSVANNNLQKIVDICNQVIKIREPITFGDMTVTFVRSVSREVVKDYREKINRENIGKFFLTKVIDEPNIILSIETFKKSIFPRKAVDKISDLSKEQLTKRRPALVCIFIDLMNAAALNYHAYSAPFGSGRLDEVATRILAEPTRSHIRQLIFFGGLLETKNERKVDFRYNSVLYNSSQKAFNNVILLPEGRIPEPKRNGADHATDRPQQTTQPCAN